jgi:hypothetical protein
MSARPYVFLTVVQPIQHGYYLVDAICEDLTGDKVRIFKGYEPGTQAIDPPPALFTLGVDQFDGLILAQFQGEKETGVKYKTHVAGAIDRGPNPIDKNTLPLGGELELFSIRRFLRRDSTR